MCLSTYILTRLTESEKKLYSLVHFHIQEIFCYYDLWCYYYFWHCEGKNPRNQNASLQTQQERHLCLLVRCVCRGNKKVLCCELLLVSVTWKTQSHDVCWHGLVVSPVVVYYVTSLVQAFNQIFVRHCTFSQLQVCPWFVLKHVLHKWNKLKSTYNPMSSNHAVQRFWSCFGSVCLSLLNNLDGECDYCVHTRNNEPQQEREFDSNGAQVFSPYLHYG